MSYCDLQVAKSYQKEVSEAVASHRRLPVVPNSATPPLVIPPPPLPFGGRGTVACHLAASLLMLLISHYSVLPHFLAVIYLSQITTVFSSSITYLRITRPQSVLIRPLNVFLLLAWLLGRLFSSIYIFYVLLTHWKQAMNLLAPAVLAVCLPAVPIWIMINVYWFLPLVLSPRVVRVSPPASQVGKDKAN
eukprot:TRINITY_DN12126_c0_g1_i1.p1 TRINITY_DN12126_c0_g1~~TRINITY_DN12126_c0_g1_i1.p1  ORF type:complete len:190 (-),score=50.42 TRINITY_DN12126_c0_g1_i1:65-634(-)